MRSQTYEQVLVSEGVQWEYIEKVDLDEIDAAKGLRNQARLGQPLDEALVDAYAQAKRDGMEFPPVTVWRPGPRSKYIPIDGNHTLAAAAKVKEKTTDIYYVKTTDALVVDRLTWSWNNKVNGKRLTPEECMVHALCFVRKYGMTIEAAAKEWGVTKANLNWHLTVENTRDTLDKNGFKGKLSDDKLYKLSGLAKLGEDLAALAADIVASNGLTGEDISDLTARVRHAPTLEGKMKVVEYFAESDTAKARKAETKGGRVERPSTLPRDRMRRWLKEGQKLVEAYPAKSALRPEHPYYKEARNRAEQLVAKLCEVFGLGAIPQKEVG